MIWYFVSTVAGQLDCLTCKKIQNKYDVGSGPQWQTWHEFVWVQIRAPLSFGVRTLNGNKCRNFMVRNGSILLSHQE